MAPLEPLVAVEAGLSEPGAAREAPANLPVLLKLSGNPPGPKAEEKAKLAG